MTIAPKSSVQELVESLPACSLLRAFDPDVLSSLLARSHIQDIAPGDDIIRQGDISDFAFILLSGSLKVSLLSADGNEIILGFAAPGEVIGEIGLIDQGARTATISATEPSRILKFQRSDFVELAREHPEALWRMLEGLAVRLRTTNRTIESDRSFTMAGRLARAMMSLTDPANNGQLRVQLSQSELGAMAGLSRENVSRQLGAWMRAGLIRKIDRRYQILDQALFADLADLGEA